MEPIYREQFTIDDMYVDCFGRLKPSALLYLAQSMAGKHCVQLHLTWEDLAAKGLFWAVVRHRVQIERLPIRGETVTLETWPMPTTRVAYPRAMAAYDAQGNVLFRTMSLWVLMDLNSRAMVLPGKSGVEVNGVSRGLELTTPNSLLPKSLQMQTSNIVAFSQLDRNGHMNNTRYLDWIFDLLPSAFHAEHPIREFVVCYLNEAREGQRVDMTWELSDGPQLQVEATRAKEDNQKSDRVFCADIRFL